VLKFLRRSLVGFVLLLVVLYLAACAYLYFRQRELLYFPQAARGVDATARPLRAPGPRVLVSTREVAGPQAVVYFGGNAEDVAHSMPMLQAAFPGASVYALHYRGYGGSEGAPTEAGLLADALALFDQVHAQHAQVTVIGRSLGSGLAVHLGSLRPAAKLVLVTPYDSIVGIAAGQYPLFPVSLLVKDRYESILYAPRVHAPTHIIAAGDDRLIPRANTDNLLRHFPPGVAHLSVVPGVGHNTISDDPSYPALLSAP